MITTERRIMMRADAKLDIHKLIAREGVMHQNDSLSARNPAIPHLGWTAGILLQRGRIGP